MKISQSCGFSGLGEDQNISLATERWKINGEWKTPSAVRHIAKNFTAIGTFQIVIGGVVLYFSATAERIVAKRSTTAENIAVKSSDGEKVWSSYHRNCGVFVHYGSVTMGNTVTRSSTTMENIMIKGS